MARALPSWALHASTTRKPWLSRAACRKRRIGASSSPSTWEPGAPWLPPGGVTPPSPTKQGTLAPRRLSSARKVANCEGIPSYVADQSQAWKGSPGFALK